MNEILSRSWWVLALRGAISILFGVLALVWPGLTLLGLVALFAVYALLYGAVSVIGAVQNRKSNEDWWLLLLLGLVGIVAGAIALVHPGLTALVLVLVMGANALVTGVLDIVAAIRLRKVIQNESLLILSGIVSIIFGIVVFLFPDAGALALVWLISFYAMLSGVLLLTLAFRVRAGTTVAADKTDRRTGSSDRRVAAGHS
ncbi:MAG: hypothetical protein JWQ21_534 [Herminiimonas sp.]|nr:hypothetical protein [Herminiimonas sp.]